MNYSALPFILDDNVNLVGVKFFNHNQEPTSKIYHYMTTEQLEKGDLVVVLSPKGFTVTKVAELDGSIKQDKKYSWIVCKLDTEQWEQNVENTAALIKQTKRIERKTHRAQLKQALLDEGMDVKALQLSYKGKK